ncbi:radical SAM/SPASM domain-containing protein [candidate division KSB1 bacterium]
MKVKYPKYLQIETTILCNGNCTFCLQSEVDRDPKYMEDDVFRKIVDESRDCGIVYRPFLQNEPFSDKRIVDFVKYIKEDKTAIVELNSNGALLNEELSERIIVSGLDLIKFSVDGFSQESYKSSGRGFNYKKVMNNVLQFAEIRNKLKPGLKIYVRMIDLQENKNEQADFLKFWEQYVDFSQIVPLYSWPWTGQDGCVPKPCPKIREEIFFCTNGNAVLCCWDYAERGVIGNIKDQTIEEIWSGEKNRKYRELLNEGKRSEIHLCSKCDGYLNYDFSDWEGY